MNPQARLSQLACRPIRFEQSESHHVGIRPIHRLQFIFPDRLIIPLDCLFPPSHSGRHVTQKAELSGSDEVWLRFSCKLRQVPGTEGSNAADSRARCQHLTLSYSSRRQCAAHRSLSIEISESRFICMT